MHVKIGCVNTLERCVSDMRNRTCSIRQVKRWQIKQSEGYEVKVKIDKSHRQARVDETKTKEVNKIKNASKER